MIQRAPLRVPYRDALLFTNPPPSSGGLLIGFALKLLERIDASGTAIDCASGLTQLASVMRCRFSPMSWPWMARETSPCPR